MKKLLIWGTGKIANKVLENGINGEIIGFIETNGTLEIYKQKKVYTVKSIPREYDYIIVANSFADEIYQTCLKEKIDLKNNIFNKNSKGRRSYRFTGNIIYSWQCELYRLLPRI